MRILIRELNFLGHRVTTQTLKPLYSSPLMSDLKVRPPKRQLQLHCSVLTFFPAFAPYQRGAASSAPTRQTNRYAAAPQ